MSATTGSVKSADVETKTATATDNQARPSEPVNEYEDAEKNYQPKSLKFWSVMIGMYLAMFLVALDRTIIATPIPKITDEFNSINDVGWYGSAYMLTCACGNPVTGRIYQIYSTKWVFMLSILVFEIGSVVCGAAPNSIAFILGRAIAGFGAAGIFSGSIMIMLPLVPLRKRPVFSSFFGLNFAISSVIGPLLGGAFTDKATWRWCFYINLPIGAFTLLTTFFFFNVDTPKKTHGPLLDQFKRLDPLGLLFFVPSITCLILAFQWAGSTYKWSNPTIIGLLVTFVATIIIFAVIEYKTPETAIAPGPVVGNRSMVGSLSFLFTSSGGMMVICYYLAIWFQATKGDTALDAGIHSIPLVLSLVLIGIPAAVLTQKIGYYVPVMLFGPILASIGAGMLSTLAPGSPMSHWIGYQVLYGLGLGCAFQSSSLVAQTVLPRKDVPIGLALGFFMQQLGGAVSVAIAQNIFATKLVDGLSGVAGLDAHGVVNIGATNLRSVVPAEDLNFVLGVYSNALTRTFLLAAALSASGLLSALLLEWKSIKGDKEKPGSPLTEDSEVEKGHGPGKI
ncbi:related to aflatoxin efflux pump AFLT [Cephalotrichum gorgonifer]|uniref:Related to aflatoxin efflux pump AFLT n=1 Tax=Cephalotrichum gorgonifer TaxID=2041049 RepID=A0AAE8N1R5_9PEZI|nr:related to aflatoxin efflux pump AFLT [Cephalotrichum gorgonifer]